MGGGEEKWRLELTSAKVEVEVEAELGKSPKGRGKAPKIKKSVPLKM